MISPQRFPLLRPLVFLCFSVLAATAAPAAQLVGSGQYHLAGPWEPLGPAPPVARQEGYRTAEIDLASLVRTGDTLVVWTKLEGRRSGLDTELIRWEILCSPRASRLLAFQFREKRRGTIRILKQDRPRLERINPGSVADLAANRICPKTAAHKAD